MPDQDPNKESAKRTLSEISHLFLSEVRDRQTSGAPRPQRVPPGQRPAVAPLDPSMPPPDLADVDVGPNSGFVSSCHEPGELELAPAPPVTAVIAAHLGAERPVRVRQYARHLAARLGRVGLIEIEGYNVRISCFEPPCDDPAEGTRLDDALPESEFDDPRFLAEAIEELDWDVRQWLLAPSNVRQDEVRSLLSDVRHWALLSTCDHDGVVSSYRSLKGLRDAVPDQRPLLTLSLLDAGGQPEMVRVFAKLSGVCQQFLDWPVEPELAVVAAPGVTEGPVLVFHPADPAADGSGPWAVLANLVARANSAEAESVAPDDMRTEFVTEPVVATPIAPPQAAAAGPGPSIGAIREDTQAGTPSPRRIAPAPTFTPVNRSPVELAGPSIVATVATSAPLVDSTGSSRGVSTQARASAATEHDMNEQIFTVSPAAPTAEIRGSNPVRLSAEPVNPAEVQRLNSRSGMSEVLETSAEGTAESILAAVLSRPEGGLVECPVRTPMCPSSRLTIDRDRRVILLAVAREGLAELPGIGQAYRWVIENRALIAMAVPQLSIDAHQFPRLRLLVDQADASAEALQPMLQSGHVSVQAYRRVRWGARTGLLLDAA